MSQRMQSEIEMKVSLVNEYPEPSQINEHYASQEYGSHLNNNSSYYEKEASKIG